MVGNYTSERFCYICHLMPSPDNNTAEPLLRQGALWYQCIGGYVDRYGAMQWDLWYRLRTHLHERGTDIKLSQALLGNN